MTAGLLGLIELLLVFGLLFGFGLWQLRSLKRREEELRRRSERSNDVDERDG